MLLSISSAAAARLPLAALVEGCRRRGLAGLELVSGGAHGVRTTNAPASRELAASHGVRPVAVRCDGDGHEEAAASLAASLGVPLTVAAAGRSTEELRSLARHAGERGIRLLLLHGSDPAEAGRLREVAAAVQAGVAGLAWEVLPAVDDPAAVEATQRDAGGAIAYVRLRGGGPEAPAQTGLGIGVLMTRLSLARFAGPLVLAPSKPAHGHAWERWLGRGVGWGCGSRHSAGGLVTLGGASA
jgi:sugar phosphate isomerase/epimerase